MRQNGTSGMLDEEGFRRWMTAYRKRNELVLEEISKMTGIHASRLSDIENRKTKTLRMRYVIAFAKALGYKRLSDFIIEVERER
jgi:transcriptional regulator with XRE-family HTH domain